MLCCCHSHNLSFKFRTIGICQISQFVYSFQHFYKNIRFLIRKYSRFNSFSFSLSFCFKYFYSRLIFCFDALLPRNINHNGACSCAAKQCGNYPNKHFHSQIPNSCRAQLLFLLLRLCRSCLMRIFSQRKDTTFLFSLQKNQKNQIIEN